jgi:F-type H+-transporting ATPase subunit gamma
VANLKSIRKRIVSVKSTQKITRAMKMVAGARLTRAQQRITALRPYAVKLGEMLAAVTAAAAERAALLGEVGTSGETEPVMVAAEHPLLARRPERSVLLVVITSDRGLCGAFNTNINRFAERRWRELAAEGKKVQVAVIGRKGREYLSRRSAPIWHVFSSVWQQLGPEQAELIASKLLAPFLRGEVDSIQLVYNEFKSAMTQRVVCSPLFPLSVEIDPLEPAANPNVEGARVEFDYEPNKDAVLEQLVPSYVEMTLLRALYESQASELGARMTAMDSATKNASEMIDRLTLQYNRARQAAITTELMEIIGGANALQE